MSSRNAEGRVLRHSLATSQKWTALPGPAGTPREIFCLIVAAVDNLGRMQACPYWWKTEMYRTVSSVTPKKIANSLEHNHNVGLIYIYEEEEGKPILQKEPPKLIGNMKDDSKFDDPPPIWERHIDSEPVNFVKFQIVSGIYTVVHTSYEQGTYNVPTRRREKGEGRREIEKGSNVEFENSTSKIFEYWKAVMGKDRAKLTTDRRAKIVLRLKEGYSVEDIQKAIDGCKRSEFHQGENDRGKKYNDLTLILRTGSKLEDFREMAEDGHGLVDLEQWKTIEQKRREEEEHAQRESTAP